jgi:Zn ribbon nucleic-acid-binding protein
MSNKGNEFGLRCPRCGNTDDLNIECRVWVTVYGNQVQDPYERSNMAYEPFSGWQWGGKDGAQCPKCKHAATVADFKDAEDEA